MASVSEVEPFLRSGKILSPHCLAVFLLNAEESQLTTSLCWAQARVALRCIANGEPMLLNGFLVQLGKQPVIQARAKHVVEVQSLPAACMKMAVYRDGVVGSWEDLVSAPIRYILRCLTVLESCDKPAESCQCGRWHVHGETGVKDPIFDLWRRQWLSLSMKNVSPSHADVFMVNVRYAKALEKDVLMLSGVGGVFLEPRTIDAREPDPEFHVLWMAKHSVADLLHLRQCTPGVLGLARLGSRLGIRILAVDMGTLGKQLKPDAILLGGGPRQEFELGPVPYGLDRSGLAKLCKEWGWMAKPVNPVKSIPGLGAVWHIQACCEPPSSVVSLKGGPDVVITKMASRSPSAVVPPPAVASVESLGLCQVAQAESQPPDPWLLKDPWGAAAAKLAHTKIGKAELGVSLQQVEQRVERAVLARLPATAGSADTDQDMGSPAGTTKTRLQELETQVAKLATGHQQLEQKVEESGRKTDAQLSQLQHQMSAQLEGQSARFEDLFRGQMSQIESLLNKKARLE